MKGLLASVTLLLIVVTPMEVRAFHNTGLASVINTFSKPVAVVDQESRGNDLGIIAVNATNAKIKLPYIPWCDNTTEVLSKALAFVENNSSAGSKILFYLCQNYRDDMVYFVPANGALFGSATTANVDWASRVKCVPAPANNIDVTVESTGLPTCTPK